MHQYKSYPVYGIAIRGDGKKWHCRGLIFDPQDQVTEVKRLERADLNFATKRKAEEYGLKLCQTWIDEQMGGGKAISPTNAAPAKDGAAVAE